MNQIKIIDGFCFEELQSNLKNQTFGAGQGNVDYSSFEIVHGYGQLSKAGVSLMQGVSGTVHIELEISTFDESSYSEATKEIKHIVGKTVTDKLIDTQTKSRYADWWLWAGYRDEQKIQEFKDSKTQDTVEITDEVRESLKTNFKQDLQKFKITGDFTFVGQSMIPTTVYLYVEMLQITTNNGNTISVINSTPVAADGNGDPSNATTDSTQKLRILKLYKNAKTLYIRNMTFNIFCIVFLNNPYIAISLINCYSRIFFCDKMFWNILKITRLTFNCLIHLNL